MKVHITIKAVIILLGGFACARLQANDQPRIVSDPVADYRVQNKGDLKTSGEKDEHFIKFEADVCNDGRKDVFLSCEKSCLYDSSDYENKVYIWSLYRNLGNGRYASIEKRKSVSVDRGGDGELEFDPGMIYIGYIKELKRYGLLAMYFLPKHNEVTLSAYIVTGNCFEQLNFPDASKPAGKYHRDDTGRIPDLPDTFKQYFGTPPKEKVLILK